MTAKFQPQVSKVALYGVRGKVEERVAEEAELVYPKGGFRHLGADSGSWPKQVEMGKAVDIDGGERNDTSSTGFSESESGPHSPSLSGQLPSPHVT